MTKAEKRIFIKTALANLEKYLLNRVDHFPEHWDGYELRQYVEDVWHGHWNTIRMDRSRKAEYNNDLRVNSLL